MSEEKDLEVKNAKKTMKMILGLSIVYFACTVWSVSMGVRRYVSKKEISRQWSKVMECRAKSMCVTVLENGEMECCDCKEVQ